MDGSGCFQSTGFRHADLEQACWKRSIIEKEDKKIRRDAMAKGIRRTATMAAPKMIEQFLIARRLVEAGRALRDAGLRPMGSSR